MADAKQAIALTLVHERGYQANPKDRRNWTSGIIGQGTLVGTKYGITPQDFPDLTTPDAMKALTPERATDYYSKNYWKKGYSQISSQAVAAKLFDMGVLMGVGTAVEALQFVLGITADGDFGPQTLTTTNAHLACCGETNVLNSFKAQLKVHADEIAEQNPNEANFKAGWEARIAS